MAETATIPAECKQRRAEFRRRLRPMPLTAELGMTTAILLIHLRHPHPKRMKTRNTCTQTLWTRTRPPPLSSLLLRVHSHLALAHRTFQRIRTLKFKVFSQTLRLLVQTRALWFFILPQGKKRTLSALSSSKRLSLARSPRTRIALFNVREIRSMPSLSTFPSLSDPVVSCLRLITEGCMRRCQSISPHPFFLRRRTTLRRRLVSSSHPRRRKRISTEWERWPYPPPCRLLAPSLTPRPILI